MTRHNNINTTLQIYYGICLKIRVKKIRNNNKRNHIIIIIIVDIVVVGNLGFPTLIKINPSTNHRLSLGPQCNQQFLTTSLEIINNGIQVRDEVTKILYIIYRYFSAYTIMMVN